MKILERSAEKFGIQPGRYMLQSFCMLTIREDLASREETLYDSRILPKRNPASTTRSGRSYCTK